jgi:hypothetical protein
MIDRGGSLVETLTDANLLDGPWDLAINDRGELAEVFVSNVLSGTVTRINLRVPKNGNPIVEGMTQIASGYGHACNAAAVVVGPTGLAYDAAKDILYVASTSDNVIFAVPHARKTDVDEGTGSLVYQDNVHLHGPLGLWLAPNGDLITANGDALNSDSNQQMNWWNSRHLATSSLSSRSIRARELRLGSLCTSLEIKFVLQPWMTPPMCWRSGHLSSWLGEAAGRVST